jgi:hypothetical protein
MDRITAHFRGVVMGVEQWVNDDYYGKLGWKPAAVPSSTTNLI